MEEEARKHSRVRSPGYPMIDLKEAIAKAKMLWDKDKNNPIPREVAAEHLGYGGAGGHAGRVIAALKHFNLIYLKESFIILTEKAIDLILHSPSDKVYIDTVKEIALNPSTYADLFNEYNGDLPSDSTLKVKLLKDYKFNADKIDRFISNFRSTIEFARLGPETQEDETEYLGPKDIIISPEDIARERAKYMTESLKKQPTTTMMDALSVKPRSFDIPLFGGGKATLMFEKYPLDEADIEILQDWLNIFKKVIPKKERGPELSDTEKE